MALHNPVEDAQRAAFGRNPRGRQALDVARAFLEAPDDDDRIPRRPASSLPAQASPVAQQRAFGQQGAVRRRPAPLGAVPGQVSPIRTFLGGAGSIDRDLLNRVMQRVFQGPTRRRF